MIDTQTVELLNFCSSLNEAQKNILLAMMKDLNSESMKKISSEDSENYIKNAFKEIKLAA